MKWLYWAILFLLTLGVANLVYAGVPVHIPLTERLKNKINHYESLMDTTSTHNISKVRITSIVEWNKIVDDAGVFIKKIDYNYEYIVTENIRWDMKKNQTWLLIRSVVLDPRFGLMFYKFNLGEEALLINNNDLEPLEFIYRFLKRWNGVRWTVFKYFTEHSIKFMLLKNYLFSFLWLFFFYKKYTNKLDRKSFILYLLLMILVYLLFSFVLRIVNIII